MSITANQLAARVVRPCYLIDFDLIGGHLYVNDTSINIEYNGTTYIGGANVGGVSIGENAGGIVSSQSSFFLNGLDGNLISSIMEENTTGRPVIVYQALLDSNYKVTSAGRVVKQYLGKVSLSIGNESGMTISAGDRSDYWKSRSNYRLTNEDHQALHPGDEFCLYTAQVPDRRVSWGI